MVRGLYPQVRIFLEDATFSSLLTDRHKFDHFYRRRGTKDWSASLLLRYYAATNRGLMILYVYFDFLRTRKPIMIHFLLCPFQEGPIILVNQGWVAKSGSAPI
jgi:hypothetical protein